VNVDPARAEALAARVAERLARLDGVAAVVLGGSRARGAAEPDSDVDLGVYYRPERAPRIEDLRALARELDDRRAEAEVADYGAWGPWVNGGAWLAIDGIQVDWLWRDLATVERVIGDCLAGRVTCDYYLGHPHGFHNHVYAAEVATCRPLVDGAHALGALRARLTPYPAALRDALVAKYLYDASFMLTLARKPARRGDVFHVAGCLFRGAAALVQVLFALNQRWFLNEKGALAQTRAFSRRPERFDERAAAVLARPGAAPHQLARSVGELERLVAETRALAG
jgi:predicted nucleotidyltransferase